MVDMIDKQEGALTGYRVLDLADEKGVYCTKLLADMGAQVIKIETPQGDQTRNIPPFAGEMPHIEKSLFFLYRNANKYGITLDLELPDGKEIFKKLVKTADVLVETWPPGYMKSLGLDYPVLKELNPGLIMAGITEFGQDGPYKDYKGAEIVAHAMSGAMISSGFPDSAPVRLPGTPSYDAASLSATMSVIISLFHRGSTQEGHYIDVSVHENARLGLYPWQLPMYSYNLNPDSPPPGRESRMGPMIYPVYPCKDGYIRVAVITTWQWEAMVRALGEPEALLLPKWRDLYNRIGDADELFCLVSKITSDFTMVEIMEKGQEEGAPLFPIFDTAGFVNNPQTKAREFFVEHHHSEIGTFMAPGSPSKWSETPCTVRRGAPCLGEHNEEIYCREMGLSETELADLKTAGVI